MREQLPANNNTINNISDDKNDGNVHTSNRNRTMVGGSKDNKRSTADGDRALQHTHYDNNAHDKLHITLCQLL